MRKMAYLFSVLALLASTAWAIPPGTYVQGNTIVTSGNKALKLPGYTVATLPTLTSADAGALVRVTDGDGAEDCTSGGGTDVNTCQWTGSAWANAGDGTAAGSAEVVDAAVGAAGDTDTSHAYSKDDIHDYVAQHDDDYDGLPDATEADAVNDTMVDWGTGANQVSAGDVPIADAGGLTDQINVEDYLSENRTAINLNTAKVSYTPATPGEIGGTTPAPGNFTSVTIDGTARYRGAYAAGSLPGDPAENDVIIVTGGLTACDNSSGGGSYVSLQRYNGTSWDCVGDGTSAGGTVDTSGTPSTGDVAIFTDQDTVQGQTWAELSREIGTDIQEFSLLLAILANNSGSPNFNGVSPTFNVVTAASYQSSAADGSRISYLPENSSGNDPTPDAGSSGFKFTDGVLYVFEGYVSAEDVHALSTLINPTYGAGVKTALEVNVGSAGAPVLFNGAGGTPSSITLTSATGLPASTGITKALPSYSAAQTLTWATNGRQINLFSNASTVEVTIWDCETANIGESFGVWSTGAGSLEGVPASGDHFVLEDGTALTADYEIDMPAGGRYRFVCIADDTWAVHSETETSTDGGAAD